MFTIFDGRTEFYQWDLDRKLIVSDESIEQVHFENGTEDYSLVRTVYEVNGVRLVDVPNILLQHDWRIEVYAYDANYTKHSDSFRVIERARPENYIYTDEEVHNFITLQQQLNRIEEAGIGGAVEDYLKKNPVKSAVTSVNGKNGAVTLQAKDVGALPDTTYIPSTVGLATKEYVDAAVQNVEAEADLSDYYTKHETDSKIAESAAQIDLSGYLTEEEGDERFLSAPLSLYDDPNFLPILEEFDKRALKEDIPSLEGYATEEHVSAAIAAAQLEGAEVDLSAFYTKSEVDGLVADATENVDLTNYYTKTETDIKVAEEVAQMDLSGYATKDEITTTSLATQGMATKAYVDNSVTGLASEQYVATKIAEAELNEKDIDLSSYALKTDLADYATEDYVDEAVGDLVNVNLDNYYTKQEVNETLSAVSGVAEVYVGVDEPTDVAGEAALIWINPAGSPNTEFVTQAYLEEYVEYVLNSIGSAEGGTF